jgi:hypothetical protein
MTASDIDDALAADVGPLPNPKADRQAQKATPNAACFEQDLYAQESDDGRDNTLEAFCAIVEKNSATAIRRLIDDPLDLGAEDRETLSSTSHSSTPQPCRPRPVEQHGRGDEHCGLRRPSRTPSFSGTSFEKRSTPRRATRRSRALATYAHGDARARGARRPSRRRLKSRRLATRVGHR